MGRWRQSWVVGVLALLACETRAPLSVAPRVDANVADTGSTPGALSCGGMPVNVPGKVGGFTAGSAQANCSDAAMRFQWRGAPAGTPCTSGIDCTPACCACAAPSRQALTSWCLDGRCATPEEACCALAGTPTQSCGAEPAP
jgi:hypothetical protein